MPVCGLKAPMRAPGRAVLPPFLAGAAFSAADAFFAPVVFRIQTYGLELDAVSRGYIARMLECESLRSWYEQALREPWRDAPHEAEIAQFGAVLQDYRVPVES
jgi:glutathione S-transferase